MSRRLDDLSPEFRPIAMALLARLVEAGIPIVIVDTLRTPAEHAANLANGTSWIKFSKHLVGDAIDVAPFEVYQLHGPDKLQWNGSDPVWARIGEIGESLVVDPPFRIRWGGRFGPPAKPDLGHFELVRQKP